MRAGVAASRKLKPKPPDQNSEASNKLKAASKTNGQRTTKRERRPSSHQTRTRNSLSVPRPQIKESSLPLSEISLKKTYRASEEVEKEILLPRRSPTSLQSVDCSSECRDSSSRLLRSNATTPDVVGKGLTNGRAFLQNSDGFSDKQKRTTLVNVASSLVAAGANASRNENLAITRKKYYRKAICLMVGGGFIFSVGITVAALYFAGYKTFQMIGPICLSIGLLLGVCGLVWIPIINTKLKRKQQMMARTFSL